MRLLYLLNLFFVCCNSFLFQSGYVPIKFKHLNITYKPKYKNLELLKKPNYAIINLIKNNDNYDNNDNNDTYNNNDDNNYDNDDDDNNKIKSFFINVILIKLFIFIKTRNGEFIWKRIFIK
jgi:hypothetical protein